MGNSMKRLLIIIGVALFIIIDISILVYPSLSNYLNSLKQTRAVTRYIDNVAEMSEDQKQKFLDDAREYNETLLTNPNRFKLTDEEMKTYSTFLDAGHSVIGVLLVEKIDIQLSVYHGVNEGVLQIGLGHMPGSSLPVGGIGTHAVITGHRGLPSSMLLTDLNRIEINDKFILYVMGETMTYQVDQILTVLPGEVDALKIDKNMDYCTLITCTPYGINSHRLLVRGHRVENALNSDWESLFADARQLDKILAILILITPALPIMAILIFIKLKKIHKRGAKRK